ncbi:hypothetical protein [Bacillus marinisedimentorum]|uniref:hypothetical protein n=1 Tax=Bacillus marinisedimentorum TaxID=1821260 RepID=UPI000AC2C5E5|nr:hypothetical protein [Bacillus marinisedimentorum]
MPTAKTGLFAQCGIAGNPFNVQTLFNLSYFFKKTICLLSCSRFSRRMTVYSRRIRGFSRRIRTVVGRECTFRADSAFFHAEIFMFHAHLAVFHAAERDFRAGAAVSRRSSRLSRRNSSLSRRQLIRSTTKQTSLPIAVHTKTESQLPLSTFLKNRISVPPCRKCYFPIR